MQITNRSPHPVKLTHIGLLRGRGRKKRGAAFGRPYPLHMRLPVEIPARDNTLIWQPRDKLDEMWESSHPRAIVMTAAGEKFQSRRFRFSRLARLEIVG